MAVLDERKIEGRSSEAAIGVGRAAGSGNLPACERGVRQRRDAMAHQQAQSAAVANGEREAT
jgi:hypothetical protein